MNLYQAIQIMKKEVTNEYAKCYLNKLDEAVDEGFDGLVTQLIYILENTKGWRGEQAREVKAFVRKWIKEKTK